MKESLRKKSFAKRKAYYNALLELGMIPVINRVYYLEKILDIHFNKNKFYEEVRNPQVCIIIKL